MLWISICRTKEMIELQVHVVDLYLSKRNDRVISACCGSLFVQKK